MKKFWYILCGLCALLFIPCHAMLDIGREKLDFNHGWRFRLGDCPDAASMDYADDDWRLLNLPHDWAIEGTFDPSNPSGTGGGALPGGIGWYRKTFVPASAEAGKKFRIVFDGVYMNAEVFLNGVSLGRRPYGYISFSYDLTPLLRWDEENVLAVRVDNSDQPNSRWYSGCGIYRNVWLVKTESVHVAEWGTYVRTNEADSVLAVLSIDTRIANESAALAQLTVRTSLVDANQRMVASDDAGCTVESGSEYTLFQTLNVKNPVRWSTETPYLYTLITEIMQDDKPIDRYETPVGIRTFTFDAENGFILNGCPTKINGVCMHHDLGCLGAAVNTRAIQRQLEILKAMGCNAIRCSHNPPAPELLDLCDRMGLLVMDEAFDMWRRQKTSHDYARYFDEWYERDLRDFVVRDRNHPSIVLWSIGNEVLEQWSNAKADTLSLAEANLLLNFGQSEDMLVGAEELSVNSLLTRHLVSFVKKLDPTRPVTAGCNEPKPGNHLFRSGALDVIGYNYHNGDISSVPANFPGKPFIITESNSALATRGYYRMPSDSITICPRRWDKSYTDSTFACSAYDNCHVPWGNTHEESLKLVRDNSFISGQFVWTGFDYIGEPTPYGWPARSSYFGIVDLAGFPKDAYYLYQSEWSDKPVLHLFPHWNWTPGQIIDMWCYYSQGDEVELFINGRSQGVRSKTSDCLHAVWRVVFEPGTVKVVLRKAGQVVGEHEIATAGKPTRIRLTPDRSRLNADGYDLSFVTVEILDEDGNLCPHADNLVNFQVEGNATIVGVDNGSPISLERFKENKRKAFNGKCLVVLQNTGEAGKVRLKAVSEGLCEAETTIAVESQDDLSIEQ